jgi:hypothetical protein
MDIILYKTCQYQYIRGPNEGHFCDRLVQPGFVHCSMCLYQSTDLKTKIALWDDNSYYDPLRSFVFTNLNNEIEILGIGLSNKTIRPLTIEEEIFIYKQGWSSFNMIKQPED